MNLYELYHEVILEHNKFPRNFGKIEYTHFSEGYNPLCGDHYFYYFKIENDKIEKISFEGKGCAISKASSSIMTEMLENKDKNEALEIFKEFLHLLKGEDIKDMGELVALKGVSNYPSRIKCATLAWHSMKSIMFDKVIEDNF